MSDLLSEDARGALMAEFGVSASLACRSHAARGAVDATMRHYCTDDLVPVCAVCMMQEHSGHTCRLINEVAPVYRRHLAALSSGIGAWPEVLPEVTLHEDAQQQRAAAASTGRTAEVDLMSLIGALQAALDEVAAGADAAIDAANAAHAAIVRASAARRDALVGAVQAHRDRKRAALSAQLQGARDAQARVSVVLGGARRAVAALTDFELAAAYGPIQGAVRTLYARMGRDVPTRPVADPTLRLLIAAEDVIVAVDELGLVVTSRSKKDLERWQRGQKPLLQAVATAAGGAQGGLRRSPSSSSSSALVPLHSPLRRADSAAELAPESLALDQPPAQPLRSDAHAAFAGYPAPPAPPPPAAALAYPPPPYAYPAMPPPPYPGAPHPLSYAYPSMYHLPPAAYGYPAPPGLHPAVSAHHLLLAPLQTAPAADPPPPAGGHGDPQPFLGSPLRAPAPAPPPRPLSPPLPSQLAAAVAAAAASPLAEHGTASDSGSDGPQQRHRGRAVEIAAGTSPAVSLRRSPSELRKFHDNDAAAAALSRGESFVGSPSMRRGVSFVVSASRAEAGGGAGGGGGSGGSLSPPPVRTARRGASLSRLSSSASLALQSARKEQQQGLGQGQQQASSWSGGVMPSARVAGGAAGRGAAPAARKARSPPPPSHAGAASGGGATSTAAADEEAVWPVSAADFGEAAPARAKASGAAPAPPAHSPAGADPSHAPPRGAGARGSTGGDFSNWFSREAPGGVSEAVARRTEEQREQLAALRALAQSASEGALAAAKGLAVAREGGEAGRTRTGSQAAPAGAADAAAPQRGQ